MLERNFVLIFGALQLWPALASPVDRAFIVKRDSTAAALATDDISARNEQENKIMPPRIYSMVIESDISLRYSTTRVTSRVANPAQRAQEATFSVVLPETAFISGFLMEIGGQVYRATVKEKEKAQAEYLNAVSAGQTAAQVATSARDSNQFTVSINIEAGAKVSFNLTFEELLTRRRGIYEQAIHVNPKSIVPQLSVRVNIFEVLPITSIKVPNLRLNEIQETENAGENEDAKIVRHNETAVSVLYEPTEAQQANFSRDGLQGQFVVQYDVDRSSVDRKGGEIHVVDGYFVHFFAPSSMPVLPKHVVFVLDTSGSMRGTKLQQTKQAMHSILDQLRPEDVFSVVEFSTEVKEWDLRKQYEPPEQPYQRYQTPDSEEDDSVTTEEPNVMGENIGPYDEMFAYPVKEDSIKRAKDFVNQMEATGATNINGALLKALENSQTVLSRIRLTPMIIFLTDGEATVGETGHEAILTNIRKANSDGVVTIFTLAFGRGTDFDFLTKVSVQNKGFARKIYEAADATLQLKGFFEEVASPLLNDVRFVYEGEDKVTEVTKTKIANYFLGTELVVAGRVTGQPALTGYVNATSARGIYLNEFVIGPVPRIPVPKDEEIPPIDHQVTNSTNSSATTSPKLSLEKIWAYLTIQDLLKQRHVDASVNSTKERNQKALELSLQYGFVTPLTSLIVVKPGETTAPAEVRPADGASHSVDGGSRFSGGSNRLQSSSSFASSSLKVGFRVPSTSVVRVGIANKRPAIRPSFPPPSKKVAATVSSRPTTQRAVTGTELHDLSPESTTVKNGPEATSEAEPSVPTASSNVSMPLRWISRFQHNDTYVQVLQGNNTLILSWKDELPDQQYDPCTVTYADSGNSATGFCKSIWKCDTIQLTTLIPETSDVCVVENKYVGVCCVADGNPVQSASPNLTPLISNSN